MLISNIIQLAEHVEAAHATPESIAHRLYHDTESGISFAASPHGISIAGYCEGSQGECRSYSLEYPFTSSDFDKLVKQADLDGCEAFDELHGTNRAKESGNAKRR